MFALATREGKGAHTGALIGGQEAALCEIERQEWSSIQFKLWVQVLSLEFKFSVLSSSVECRVSWTEC